MLLLMSVAMIESAVYRPHAEAPAVAALQPPISNPDFRSTPSAAADAHSASAAPDTRARCFQVVSRGDFVPGILYTPAAAAKPAPLLLIPHGGADDPHAPLDAGVLSKWAAAGIALALIDLPLYGRRSSPKLSERLRSGVAAAAEDAPLDLDTGALVEEFSRQATSDLIRVLDAMSALPEIDTERIGFLGFGAGAVAGSYLLGHDARVKAAVLGNAGGGQGPEALDPAVYIAKASETALFFVSSKDSASPSAAAIKTLIDAAPEPKQHSQYSGSASEFPPDAWDEIDAFLSKNL
ncbi:MAG: hypothetical protein AB8G23_21490 [Myxococcota bacterium]